MTREGCAYAAFLEMGPLEKMLSDEEACTVAAAEGLTLKERDPWDSLYGSCKYKDVERRGDKFTMTGNYVQASRFWKLHNREYFDSGAHAALVVARRERARA